MNEQPCDPPALTFKQGAVGQSRADRIGSVITDPPFVGGLAKAAAMSG